MDFETEINKLPPEIVSTLKGLKQNNLYHKETVYEHIEMVWKELEKMTEDTDTFIACIFHDLGKLDTTTQKEWGTSTKYHEYYSLTYLFKYKHLFPITDYDKVFYIIENHMKAHDYVRGIMKKKSSIKKMEANVYFEALKIFSICDDRGRIKDES